MNKMWMDSHTGDWNLATYLSEMYMIDENVRMNKNTQTVKSVVYSIGMISKSNVSYTASPRHRQSWIPAWGPGTRRSTGQRVAKASSAGAVTANRDATVTSRAVTGFSISLHKHNFDFFHIKGIVGDLHLWGSYYSLITITSKFWQDAASPCRKSARRCFQICPRG